MSSQAEVHSIDVAQGLSHRAGAVFRGYARCSRARSRPRCDEPAGGSRRNGPITGKNRSSDAASKWPRPRPRSFAADFRRRPTIRRRSVNRWRSCGGQRPAYKTPRGGSRWSASGSPCFTRPYLSTTVVFSGSRTWPPRTSPARLAALTRMIDALEAYLRVAPPSGLGQGDTARLRRIPRLRRRQSTPPEFETIAIKFMDDEPAVTATGEAITEATTDVSPQRGETQQAQLDRSKATTRERVRIGPPDRDWAASAGRTLLPSIRR